MDTLKSAGPFTVFAPTDAAFAELPAGTLDALLADIPTLKNILLYHVLAGKVSFDAAIEAALSANPDVPTALAGKSIHLSVVDEELIVNNDAEVIPTLKDLEASNGLIHVVRNSLQSLS